MEYLYEIARLTKGHPRADTTELTVDTAIADESRKHSATQNEEMQFHKLVRRLANDHLASWRAQSTEVLAIELHFHGISQFWVNSRTSTPLNRVPDLLYVSSSV